jgi:CelD/BcsL family acetyltransferase involved in cellulose biosynthesis
MFNTEIITDQNRFNSLKGEWNYLLQNSRTNTLFLTWEWLYAWWVVFGAGADLFIITVRNLDGELTGLAPLLIRKTRYYRIPVREVAFIGTGISDSQDIIVAAGNEEVVKRIVSAILAGRSNWDIVRLEEVPNGGMLHENIDCSGLNVEHETCSTSPYLKLEGDWQEYFKTLSKKYKKDLRNKQNKIARLGNFDYTFNGGQNDDAESLVDMMAGIDGKSRKEGHGISFYSATGNREFMHTFLSLSKGKQWLDFTSASLNGTLIAYLLGFHYNNTYIAYNTAFSEEFHEASPGKLLLHEKIKWCFDKKRLVSEFNFSRGDTYIKTLWATQAREQCRIVFFKNTLYSQLIRHAVFTIRPAIKAFIKDKVGDTQKGKNVQEVD